MLWRLVFPVSAPWCEGSLSLLLLQAASLHLSDLPNLSDAAFLYLGVEFVLPVFDCSLLHGLGCGCYAVENMGQGELRVLLLCYY